MRRTLYEPAFELLRDKGRAGPIWQFSDEPEIARAALGRKTGLLLPRGIRLDRKSQTRGLVPCPLVPASNSRQRWSVRTD